MDHRRQPDQLGMVGNHEEVQRPDELHRLTGVRYDLLATSEAIPLVHPQGRPHQPGVEREIGVEVRVPEEDLVGIIPADIRRVDPLLGEVVLGDVVGLGFLGRQRPGIH